MANFRPVEATEKPILTSRDPKQPILTGRKLILLTEVTENQTNFLWLRVAKMP